MSIRPSIMCLVAGLALVMTCRPTCAQSNVTTASISAETGSSFQLLHRQAESAIAEHLDFGVRGNHFWLLTTHDDFIGTVSLIEAENEHIPDDLLLDDWWPNGLYMLWRFNDTLAAELTYTKQRVEAWSNDSGHTDGTLIVGGPVLTFIRRFPNSTPWTPYAGLGLTFFLSTSVDGNNPWHNGFGGRDWEGYNEWVQSGSPAWPNGGYQRTFKLSKEIGQLLDVGLERRISDHWSADLNMRYTRVTFENTYTLSYYGNHVGSPRYSEWDLSNFNLGIGAKYNF